MEKTTAPKKHTVFVSIETMNYYKIIVFGAWSVLFCHAFVTLGALH